MITWRHHRSLIQMNPPRVRGLEKRTIECGRRLVMCKKEYSFTDYTLGQLNALVKKMKALAGNDAPERFLRGELLLTEVPQKKWIEKEGVIYFSVTSGGTIEEEWTSRLEKKGYRVDEYAKSILRSSCFKPTSKVTTHVAVLKGSLFIDTERISKKIRADAKKHGFTTPDAEVACLIREFFTDEELKEMGLSYIAVFHEPIKVSGGVSTLLSVNYCYDNVPWLGTRDGEPGRKWCDGGGFAFASATFSL